MRGDESACLPRRCQRREHESLREFGLPLKAFYRFSVVDPFATAFIPLQPVSLKLGGIKLVEVVRCGHAVNRRYVFRNSTVHTRCVRLRHRSGRKKRVQGEWRAMQKH